LFKFIATYNDHLFYLAASFFGAALGFLLLPIFTNYLSPEDFGIVGFVQSINSFLAPIFSLSLGSYYIKKYQENQDQTYRQELLSSLLLFTLLWTSILILVLLTVGYWIYNNLIAHISFYPYMFTLTISNIGLGITSYQLVLNRLERKPIQYFINTVIGASAVILMPLLIVIEFLPSAEGRLYGVAIGTIGTGLYALIALKGKINLKINYSIIKDAIKFSSPLIPYSIILLFFDTIDRIILEKHAPLKELGFYNMASQFSMLGYMASTAFYKAYEPELFSFAAKNETHLLFKRINQSTLIFITINGIIFIVSPIIINFFTHNDFNPSIPIARILVISTLVQSVNLLLLTIYTILGKTRQMLVIVSIALISYSTFLLTLPSIHSESIAWSKLFLQMNIFLLCIIGIFRMVRTEMFIYMLIGTVCMLSLFFFTFYT
jgi:O-antigen/teichoic acid export membrane protein